MSFVAVRPCCLICSPQHRTHQTRGPPALEQNTSPAMRELFFERICESAVRKSHGRATFVGEATRTSDFVCEGALMAPKTCGSSMLVSISADFCEPVPERSCQYGAGASESVQNGRPECPQHSGGSLAEDSPLCRRARSAPVSVAVE